MLLACALNPAESDVVLVIEQLKIPAKIKRRCRVDQIVSEKPLSFAETKVEDSEGAQVSMDTK